MARREVLAQAHRDTYQELYRLEGAIRELDALTAASIAVHTPDHAPASTAEGATA